MGWFASLFLGASLAACTGLRAFLPLLEVALLSRYHLVAGFRVPETLRWLESDPVLLGIAALAALEILADKLPLVARFADWLVLILRPAASVFACLAVMRLPNMTWEFVAALTVGLTVSLPFLSLRSGTRVLAGGRTGGFLSPTLSLAEDVLAGVGALLAFWSPVVVFLALVAGGFYLQTRVRLETLRRNAPPPVVPATDEPPPAPGYGPPQPGLRQRP